jgi:hypothetical protein
MFPFNSSLTRRLASLHRIARGSLLRLPRYHQGVPTSYPPFRPTHFLLRLAIPRTAAAREEAGSCRLPAPRRNCAGASILFLRPRSWRRAGSPRFLGNPFPNMLCSSTPADRMHPATSTHSVLPSVRLTTSAPRSVTFRGSITRPVRSLSTLRGSDYSDDTTQDSLPAGGQPWRGRT